MSKLNLERKREQPSGELAQIDMPLNKKAALSKRSRHLKTEMNLFFSSVESEFRKKEESDHEVLQKKAFQD